MKKIQKSLLLLLAAAAVLPACKKGAEDPGMPFSSRKARVEGIWNIVDLKTVSTFNNNTFNCGNNVLGSDKSTGTETITNTTYGYTGSNTVTCGATSVITNSTLTGTVSKYSITFDKAGTWTAEMNYVTIESINNLANVNPAPPAGSINEDKVTSTYTVKTSGVWNFLGKMQDDTKNKEEISVSTLSDVTTVAESSVNTDNNFNSGTTILTTTADNETSTKTFNVNENVSIWKLVRLAKKEMKVIRSDKGTNIGNNTSGAPAVTTNFNYDNSSETTMTWNQL